MSYDSSQVNSYATSILKMFNSSFSLSRNKHGTKKYIWNRPVEEAKKMKCYKRLIYKQFVQNSGVCGPQFLSYLPKRFTHGESIWWRHCENYQYAKSVVLGHYHQVRLL